MPAKKMKAKSSRVRALEFEASLIDCTEKLRERMYMEERLIEANELLKQRQETMREHAGVVVELNERLAEKTHTVTDLAQRNVELAQQLALAQTQADRHLREIHDQVDANRKDNAAAQAEIEYWMAEVNRLHYELIDIRREAARDGVS